VRVITFVLQPLNSLPAEYTNAILFLFPQIPKLVLPTDRLLAGYERRFPETSDEVVRTVDGLLVNRSMVFVQKQHDFIKQGHTEAEAFKLTEKALVEEEGRALKQLEEMTAEARAKGAVPALSAIEREREGDSRWERLQFWRKELGESPYESWSHGKRASLDRWLTKDLLGWAPHQTRYLGQNRFMVHLQAVRELIFADVQAPLKQRLREGVGMGLTEKELFGLRYETAMGEYREWEGRLRARRWGDWGKEQVEELHEWVDENYGMVLAGVEDAWPQVEGGVTDVERKAARRQVLMVMAFPLLRPEMQGVPYLSRHLTKAFLEVSRYEACAGLRPIVSSSGPLGKAKACYATGESMLSDAMPKLVVKSFVTLALERPFAWQLLRYLLVYRISNAPSVAALEGLPELRGMGGRGEIAKRVEGQWKNLTEILMTLAANDDTSGLSQDIEMAYEGINELHRVAQELLFLGAEGEGGREGGHSFVDREIDAYIAEHHGWVDEDLAIGEVLRRYDATVDGMFGAGIPPAHKAEVARVEKRESEVLESARLDFAFSKREGSRMAWEMAEGMQEVDAYDREWLTRRRGEEGDEGREEAVNGEDWEEWRLELKASGIKTAEEEEEEENKKKAAKEAKSMEAGRGAYEPRGEWQWGGSRGGRRESGRGGRGGWDRSGVEGRDRDGQYGRSGRGAGGIGREYDRRASGAGTGGSSSFADRNRFASPTGGGGQRWPSSDSNNTGKTERSAGGAGSGAFGRGGGGSKRGGGVGGRGGGERSGMGGVRGRGRGIGGGRTGGENRSD